MSSTYKFTATSGTTRAQYDGVNWTDRSAYTTPDGFECAYPLLQKETQGRIISQHKYYTRINERVPTLERRSGKSPSKTQWISIIGPYIKQGAWYLPYPVEYMRRVVKLAMAVKEEGTYEFQVKHRHSFKEYRVKEFINQVLREASSPFRLSNAQTFGRLKVHVRFVVAGLEELVHDNSNRNTAFHRLDVPFEVAALTRHLLNNDLPQFDQLKTITNLELHERGVLFTTAKKDRHSPRTGYALKYADWSDYADAEEQARERKREELFNRDRNKRSTR